LPQSADAPGTDKIEKARAGPQRGVNGEIVVARLSQHIRDKPFEVDSAFDRLDERGVPQRHSAANPEGELELLRQAPGPLSRAESDDVHMLVHHAEQQHLSSCDRRQCAYGIAKLSLLVKQRLSPF
jgi:hypothetical protein